MTEDAVMACRFDTGLYCTFGGSGSRLSAGLACLEPVGF